jgi:hypothetical protein
MHCCRKYEYLQFLKSSKIKRYSYTSVSLRHAMKLYGEWYVQLHSFIHQCLYSPLLGPGFCVKIHHLENSCYHYYYCCCYYYYYHYYYYCYYYCNKMSQCLIN